MSGSSIGSASVGRERLVTREFLILATATMLYFVTMGAANPLLPKFVVDELGGSEVTVGVAMGSFAVAALAVRSLFGRLGDRHGARLLMLIGCALAAISMLVLVFTTTVALAVVSRLLHGAGQGAVMTGAAVLAIDLAPESRRGGAASYILVSFHLGLGLGPVGGEALLRAASYETLWFGLAVISVAAGGVALLLPRRPGDPEAPPSPWIHPAGIAPGLVAAFGIMSFSAFITFVPLYGRKLGLDEVGLVFTVASIAIAIARLVLGRCVDLLGPVRAGSIALVLTIAGAAVLAGWQSVTGIYLAAAVLAGGMSLQTPAMIQVAVAGAEPRQRSSAMATFTMFIDASVALTGPLIGLIVSGAGYRTAFATTAVSALVALLLLRGVLAPRWRVLSAPAVA